MMSTLTYENRLSTLRQIAADAALDAIALMPASNLTYVTGAHLHMMERPTLGIFPAEGEPLLILPALEVSKLANPPFPLKLFSYTDDEGYAGAFEEAAEAANLDGLRLGVEGLALRFVEAEILRTYAPGVRLVDATEPLAALRLRKGPAEIAAMRRAIAISQEGLEETVSRVQAGMTEREIAAELQVAMLLRGGGPVAFDSIVLTGPQSALPHGVPGNRALAEGEILLIDFGTTFDGYAADITRTFVLGELKDARLRDAYAAVQAANEAGRKAAGPGVPAQEVDRAARQAIVKAGFGPYFNHRTGHGLGMEVHEGPYIRGDNTTPLEPGNVFTVEPGVYLEGVGGIRIEDNVLITEDGAESLSDFPRDLRSLG